MKDKFKYEYPRRTRLIVKSIINVWAISLLRYGAGLLKWTREELEWMERKTRKLMLTYKTLHRKSDFGRLYVPRRKAGRGLISC